MNITHTKTFKANTKPVLKPSAQLSSLCAARNIDVAIYSSVMAYVNRTQHSNSVLPAVVSLMFMHGLRITEVLNIKSWDVLSNNRIKIKGLKGSNDRIVQVTHNNRFWTSYGQSTSELSSTYNRYFFYREFKKLGFYARFGQNSKDSVTHAMRHMYVLELKSNEIETELIQSSIGHKTIKSTKHYEQKEKC